jgi:hypothetical protein
MISKKFNKIPIVQTLAFSIENATTNQEFLASNFAIYKLDDSNLIIKANDLPISIAGIIENEEYLYSEKYNFTID